MRHHVVSHRWQPTLLDWAGPAVVTTVKVDMLDATETPRGELGPATFWRSGSSKGR